MDYLLFSYSIYYQGLPPPHIAAGINLNIPIVGSLLRRGGAFFIRRQFKDNPLYKAVLEAYLHEMFNQGFSLEYFIEGGRSRTGFLLPPKPGMLAMSLRAAISSEKNVAFIPVYIGYERLVESHSYIKELYGKDKQSESLGGVIQAAKYLKENFGQVHLNIGEAIFSDQAFNHAREESNNPSNDSQLVFHGVNWLGDNILKNINASAIVTPTNLIATALLSSKQQALLKHQLGAQIALLLSITKQFNYRCSEAHTDEHAINHWIHSAQDKQSIQVRQNPWGDICYLDQSARISSTYLRNNCLHIFILPSLIATLITRNKRIRRKQLGLICHRLLPFIQSELFLTLNQDTLDAAIESSLRLFEKQGMISLEGNTILACDEERESFYQLSLLAGISKAAIERFYIASQCLLYPEHHEDNGKRLSYHTQETLLHACMIRAEQLSLLHSFHAPDFFDKNLFKSFIEQLIKQGIISTQDSQALIPDYRLKNALKLANFVLPIDTQRSIKQLGRNDD